MLIHDYESKDIRKRAHVTERKKYQLKPYNQETCTTIEMRRAHNEKKYKLYERFSWRSSRQPATCAMFHLNDFFDTVGFFIVLFFLSVTTVNVLGLLKVSCAFDEWRRKMKEKK